MENVEQNNILLAEFLEIPRYGKYFNVDKFEDFPEITEIKNGVVQSIGVMIPVYGLKFHSDWNWLMQVVEKIEALEFKGLTFTVDILRRDTQVNYYGYVEINNVPFDLGSALLHSEGTTKIEATYNACIEFINWYNINS